MRPCPICHQSAFKDHGGRALALCTSCGSLERHRAIVDLLERLPEFQGRTGDSRRCLEVAPLNQMVYGKWLEARGWSYVCTDKWRTGNPNDPRAVGFIDYEADLTNMFMFPDGSFDLIVIQHVIEEIPQYMRALAEVSRLLSPEGVALLEIPFDRQRRRSRLTPPNHFGNVWQFGSMLLNDVRAALPATETVMLEEGVYRGELLVCRKGPGQLSRPVFDQTVYLMHGQDPEYAANLEALLLRCCEQNVPILSGDEYLGGRPGVLITSDDGHIHDLEIGLPLLEKYDASMIAFLIPLYSDMTPRVTDWGRWRAASPRIEIGSHSLTHGLIGTAKEGAPHDQKLANVMGYSGFPTFALESGLKGREYLPHLGRQESLEEQRIRRIAELGFSRQYIERAIGAPVRFFAYPWGKWDPLSVALVREAGYEAAFSTELTDGSRFTVQRLNLPDLVPLWNASRVA